MSRDTTVTTSGVLGVISPTSPTKSTLSLLSNLYDNSGWFRVHAMHLVSCAFIQALCRVKGDPGIWEYTPQSLAKCLMMQLLLWSVTMSPRIMLGKEGRIVESLEIQAQNKFIGSILILDSWVYVVFLNWPIHLHLILLELKVRLGQGP